MKGEIMVKTTCIILILTFLVACGEKQTELTPKVKEVTSNTAEDEVKSVAVTTEYVPAHITNSTIEVVSH